MNHMRLTVAPPAFAAAQPPAPQELPVSIVTAPDGALTITLEGDVLHLDARPTRAQINALEDRLALMPQTVSPLKHNFANGTYVRTIVMHKGTLVVGRRHKMDHIALVMSGSATVLSEDREPEFLTAPAVFNSAAGARRVLLVHEVMVFSTVHRTDVTDPEGIEFEIAEPSHCGLPIPQGPLP